MLTILLWVLCPPTIIFLYSGMAVLTFRACLKLVPDPEGDLFVLCGLAALGWPIGILLVSGALFAQWLLDRPRVPRVPRARVITRSNRND